MFKAVVTEIGSGKVGQYNFFDWNPEIPRLCSNGFGIVFCSHVLFINTLY